MTVLLGHGSQEAEGGTDAPGTVLPLTAAQSGMWYAQALDPLSPAQNTAECLEVDGPLDPGLFAAALRRVTTEADALRVRVEDTPEGPRQHVRAAVDVPLTVHDLRDTADTADTRRRAGTGSSAGTGTRGAERRADAWMRADLAEPCDLTTGPLFRHALFRVGERRWLWYQRVHHLVMDGFGHALLVRRTAEVYSALVRGDEPPPRSFGALADLVAQDAAYRASDAFAADRAHWAAALADRPGAPRLAGRGALPSRTSLRRTALLGPGTTERLRALATRLGATWPDVLIAAQALYTSRATGRADVVLGLPVTGRVGPAARRVPGMVGNVLPLRLAVSPGDTFAELVRRVVLGVRAARRHQRYRYEDIRRDLGLLGGDRGLVGPLVDVTPSDHGVGFAGAPARVRDLSAGPVDDLTVTVHDRADGRGVRVDHDGNPALYTDADLAAHQDRFLHLLDGLATADPHTALAAHGVATPAEHALLFDEFNGTGRAVPPTTLIGPVEAQAARTPDATALVHGATTLTYARLNARANQLARHLRALGARPDTLVAVCVPRSVELVVSLLAVLKSGAAYLPLDPDHPVERRTYPLGDAAPVCAVIDRAGRLPEGTGTPLVPLDTLGAALSEHLTTDPARPLTPAHPAYVVHMSGPTGRPEGVVVPHGAIDNRLRWMQDTYRLRPDDRVLQKAPVSSDAAVWEFFWPLREGATLVVADPGAHRDPARLARVIREQAVTTCHFGPSALQTFLAGADTSGCQGLRRVLCGGEALPRRTANAFARALPSVGLHHLYGPAEAAAGVTHHTCEADGEGPVPIGRPVWNTRLHVLDAALRPCPPGVPGELYLAGRQLADPCLGRPRPTAARFVADPFDPHGGRMYRTGDLARWTRGGEIEYLGRAGHQVGLRGRRVGLGEVEAALAARDGVDAACALVREDRPGEQRLIGYVTGTADPAAVRTALARELPGHLVPAAVVALDAFPLSPHGTLDHGGLPAPAPQDGAGARPPSGPAEELLTRLFAEVLDIERAGPDDAFFDLGGTSLLAVRLVARIREETGAEPTIGALFEAPTPAALAARLG